MPCYYSTIERGQDDDRSYYQAFSKPCVTALRGPYNNPTPPVSGYICGNIQAAISNPSRQSANLVSVTGTRLTGDGFLRYVTIIPVSTFNHHFPSRVSSQTSLDDLLLFWPCHMHDVSACPNGMPPNLLRAVGVQPKPHIPFSSAASLSH
jgi:hypothetical protein